jgi:hypothetical protein
MGSNSGITLAVPLQLRRLNPSRDSVLSYSIDLDVDIRTVYKRIVDWRERG